MKQLFALLLMVVSFGFTTEKTSKPVIKNEKSSIVNPGIFLFIPGITSGAGDPATGHGDEVEILAISEEASSVINSPGGSPSVPQLSAISFVKSFDLSSLRIKANYFRGLRIPTLEIRFYKTSVTTPVYKLVLTSAYFSTVGDGSGGGCSTCPDLSENYGLVFSKIQFVNNIPSTPQILTYDVVNNTVTGL